MDWLRVNTWSDHGRQVEDVRRRLVDLDWRVADGHVLVDQESRLGGAPGDLYAADGFWTLTQLLAATPGIRRYSAPGASSLRLTHREKTANASASEGTVSTFSSMNSASPG
jgi:hypothetical protein